MQRDMELIRELLLKLESLSLNAGSLSFEGEEWGIPDYSSETIEYHLDLLHDAKLIKAEFGDDGTGGFICPEGLTWLGHDFLDSIRDPEIWRKTKEGAKQAGGFSFDLLKALAKGFLKKAIEDKTGITLDM